MSSHNSSDNNANHFNDFGNNLHENSGSPTVSTCSSNEGDGNNTNFGNYSASPHVGVLDSQGARTPDQTNKHSTNFDDNWFLDSGATLDHTNLDVENWNPNDFNSFILWFNIVLLTQENIYYFELSLTTDNIY